jgi:phosphohistidine swiveling domain-containing protein
LIESVYFFSKIKKEHRRLAGGKGNTLAYLYQKNYPVPNGFVIMPSAFQHDEISPEAWKQVQMHLRQLRKTNAGTSFAVRSSALGEDSITASFAGQFETILRVHTDEEVRQSIQAVRRSGYSEGVQVYCAAKGLEESPDMAVVVQQLITADISGVLFTADPVTGSCNEMTGNFIMGLGEALVSGQVEPLVFTLKRSAGFTGRNVYCGPPAVRPFARRLYKLGQHLEQEFGCPQDIEWAIAGSKLYILQSRPITTMNAYNPLTGEFNDSLSGDYLWTNVNFGEGMPKVMTPLSWSLVQRVFESCSNFLPGFKNSGNICGRPYLNLSIPASILQSLGVRRKTVLKILESMYTRLPKDIEIPTIPMPPFSQGTILLNFVKMIIKFNKAFRKLPGYLADNPVWCEKMRESIYETRTREELISLWLDEIEPHLLQGAWIYVGSASRLPYINKLRSKLTRLVGAEDADQLISNLGCVLYMNMHSELLASLGPILGIAQVASGKMDSATYIAQYGHRGPNEFELSVPRSAEDPAWFNEQLKRLEIAPVDVEALLRQQRTRFTDAWQRLRANHPYRALLMQHRIKEAALRNYQREAGRSEYTRDRWLARAFALQAAHLTSLGDDIFFLTIDELLEVLAVDATAVDYIAIRKQMHKQYMSLPAYPPFIRGRFEPSRWSTDPKRRIDIYDPYNSILQDDSSHLQRKVVYGTPVSAGRIEGIVRRLDHPKDGEQLQEGEILVTALTDISWTPLFLRAAAIVTDVGAPLSHSAIVARELGIPAVVGCGNATVYLKTGDYVIIDGGLGVVEIIRPTTDHLA